MKLVLGLVYLTVVAPQALAQVDRMLFKPSGQELTPESLDSDRYKVSTPKAATIERPRPKPTAKPKAARALASEKQDSTNAAPAAAAPAAAPVTATEPQQATGLQEQVHDLIAGKSSDIEEYNKQVHPDDPRTHLLNISLAPTYYYFESQSNYSFRRYLTSGPGLQLGMSLWLTPFFGVQSRYLSSVGGSVEKAGVAYPQDLQVWSAGVRFRRHFGYSRKAPQLTWGLDFMDSNLKISRNTSLAVGRRTSGVALVMEATIPSSVTYAHALDLVVQPRGKHSELGTGVDVRSGSSNQTDTIGFGVGGEWTLDKRHQLYWRSQLMVERNLFQGPASTADSASGQTPDGVSVTGSLIYFSLGFKWGS